MCVPSTAVWGGCVLAEGREQTQFLLYQLVHLFQVMLIGSGQNKAWLLIHTETRRRGKVALPPSAVVNEQACVLLDCPRWVFWESASQQGQCGALSHPYCDRVGDPFNCILCSWPRLGRPDCYQTATDIFVRGLAVWAVEQAKPSLSKEEYSKIILPPLFLPALYFLTGNNLMKFVFFFNN